MARIVWLTPGRGFSQIGKPTYSLPLFEEFQRLFPDAVFMTTGHIDPYYTQRLNIRSRGYFLRKSLRPHTSSQYYGRGVNYLSPAILFDLLRLRPKLVISQEFNLWTILAALLKPIGKWKLLVLWTGSSPGADLLDDPLRIAVRRAASRFIDIAITNSMKGKQYLCSALRIPDERVLHIIYKPGDPQSLSVKSIYDPLMEMAPHPRFLYAGQLIPRKGVDYLLSAWSILQKLTSAHGSLLIIGEGSQHHDLQQQVKALLLTEVYFTGKVEHAALGSWYRSCDVFVFPTLEDTWGNVVPEAMAFGKPVLCSQYACAAELVDPGQNGFIFDPKNPQELAGFMLKLINSPQLTARFSQKSKEIMKSHTMKTAVRAISDVIQPLLEGTTR